MIWPAPVRFYLERCLIIANEEKKPSCFLRRLYILFWLYLHQISIFYMLMEAFRKTVNSKWNKGQINDFVEGVACCLKMNFCRKTLIKQDRFTQNREEIKMCNRRPLV